MAIWMVLDDCVCFSRILDTPDPFPLYLHELKDGLMAAIFLTPIAACIIGRL